MLKKIVLIVGLLLLAAIIMGAVGVYYFKADKTVVLNFIKNNPDKASIKLVRNDSVLADINSDRMQPLASTVKLIMTVEYAEQAASKIINPDELIDLSELDVFYVENSDGGAHPGWLKYIEAKIIDNKISIRDITKGMIMFSSNANTEWLSKRLGLENIHKRLDSLGIKNHSEIYYLASSLFVGKELFPDLKNESLEKALRNLSTEDYIKATEMIHEKLLNDSNYKNERGDRSMNIQRVWSDNLPASTTSEYISLLNKINSRTYFSENTQKYLDEILEFLLENPRNRQWLEHAGMKGGSTAFVLTKAFYATDTKGNKTELAYFLNDLDYLENRKIQVSMNAFELAILNDAEFRKLIITTLKD